MCLILGLTGVAHLMPAASTKQPDMLIPQLWVGMPDYASNFRDEPSSVGWSMEVLSTAPLTPGTMAGWAISVPSRELIPPPLWSCTTLDARTGYMHAHAQQWGCTSTPRGDWVREKNSGQRVFSAEVKTSPSVTSTCSISFWLYEGAATRCTKYKVAHCDRLNHIFSGKKGKSMAWRSTAPPPPSPSPLFHFASCLPVCQK